MGFAGRAPGGGDALPLNTHPLPIPAGSCPQSQHKPLRAAQVH